MVLRIGALDDDESILFTLQAMAQTQRWTFYKTRSVEVCLDWVRKEALDILLLDYHMPACNGLDVLRSVTAINEQLPVLILTVEQSPRVAESLVLAGAQDFISKPIRLADFLSRIRLHQQLSMHREQTAGRMQKGISEQTLRRVVNCLKQSEAPIEIEAVASFCELGYTTAHRYLDYLVKRRLAVCSELFFDGKPGRPSKGYRFKPIE